MRKLGNENRARTQSLHIPWAFQSVLSLHLPFQGMGLFTRLPAVSSSACNSPFQPAGATASLLEMDEALLVHAGCRYVILILHWWRGKTAPTVGEFLNRLGGLSVEHVVVLRAMIVTETQQPVCDNFA